MPCLPAVERDDEVIRLAAGASLFAKGDKADTMYIVRSGCLQVHDGDTVFQSMRAGEVLGERAIVDGAPRSAGMRAPRSPAK